MIIKENYIAQQTAVCSILGNTVLDYFKTPEHRAEFENWYLDRYGEPYEWKSPVYDKM